MDVRAVEDVHIGATDSPEFREVNKRIKTRRFFWHMILGIGGHEEGCMPTR